MSNDIDSGGFGEGAEGDSDYTGDDSFTESDYATSDDYEEVEYDYQLAEDPVPLEEVGLHHLLISAVPRIGGQGEVKGINTRQATNQRPSS